MKDVSTDAKASASRNWLAFLDYLFLLHLDLAYFSWICAVPHGPGAKAENQKMQDKVAVKG